MEYVEGIIVNVKKYLELIISALDLVVVAINVLYEYQKVVPIFIYYKGVFGIAVQTTIILVSLPAEFIFLLP